MFVLLMRGQESGTQNQYSGSEMPHSQSRLDQQADPLKEQGAKMPLIQVKVIEGVFDSAQKKQMITKLTDAMVSIEGESLRGVTWVTIEEVRSGEWGVGGTPLSTSAVLEMAAAK